MKKLFTIIVALMISLTLVNFQCNDNIVDPPPGNPPGYQFDIPWPSLADSPWPMGNHDPQNSGRSNNIGPSIGHTIDAISAYNLQAGVVIGEDSTIYFITSNPAILTAVKFSGNIRWEKEIAVESITTPLISSDNIIFAAGGFSLYAFSILGDSLWEFRCEGSIESANLNIDKDGNIYVIDDTHSLYSILPDGTLKWKITDTRIPALALHNPAFSPDGNSLYVQGDEVSLLAIDITTHSVKWTFGDRKLFSAPLIDSQGNIYILPGDRINPGGGPYTFYSLEPDGSTRWSYQITDEYLGLFDAPTIDRAGNVYFGNDTLYSFSYSGNMNWKIYIGKAAIRTSIICDKNNAIYFGTGDQYLYSFFENSQLQWKLLTNSTRSLISPIIGSDGLILLPIFGESNIYLIE